MPNSHYQLLANCSDDLLRRICERRRLPLPQRWEDGPEGRVRLLKTMLFHLEDNKKLTDVLADLHGQHLKELKDFAEGGPLPSPDAVEQLSALGLVLPSQTEGPGSARPPRGGQRGDAERASASGRSPLSSAGTWKVPERVADALADFDESAFSFQGREEVQLLPPLPYGFALALNSVLLRCTAGIRVLKGGLPAKKELGQLQNRNALIQDERDATLIFALLHRLGLLWSRDNRVDTLVPAVLAQSPRWVPERAFALLLEHDLKQWDLPPAEDRRFVLQHLLERRGQVLALGSFLDFLCTLHPLDAERTRSAFLPFLGRMGLICLDAAGEHLTLSAHGEALAQEYLLRDHRGTEEHWQPLLQDQPLVIQPTLELLTPMAQHPHRLLLLAQLADVTTLDAMVTLRLGSDTLVRALDAGVSLEEIRARLERSGASFPQPLTQLLEDLSQRLGEVEVLQGMRLVKARSAELAEELTLRPELASLNLKPLSGTVLEANGPGNAFALLKQAGFMPKPGRFLPVSIDGDESLYLWSLACLAFVDEKGMNHFLEPVRQIIHAALQRIQNEDPVLFQEIKRRVPMLHLGAGAQAAEETQRILEYAASFGFVVELTYMPLAAHRSQVRRVTPRNMEGEHLRAFCHLHQEEMSFRLGRILGVRLLNEKGWSPAPSGCSTQTV